MPLSFRCHFRIQHAMSLVLATVLALLLSGCDKLSGSDASASIEMADTIYTGTIITMDDIVKSAEAVAVADGRIVAVGNRAAVMKHKHAGTRMVELGEQLMLPGFIDVHSHFMQAVIDAGGGMAAIQAVQETYAANGYTTITEGSLQVEAYRTLRQAAGSGLLFLDVVGVARFEDMQAFRKEGVDLASRDYTNRLRIGGIKLVIDGSPAEKQAYLSLPLLLADGPDGEKSWRGEARYNADELDKAVRSIIQQGAQVFAEAHGDSAIGLIVGSLAVNGVNLESDRRDVVVHASFLRGSDQMRELERMGVVPSFCTNRIYQEGDVYMQTIGGKRAIMAQPVKSAYYVKFSLHTDYPETSLEPGHLLWTAANRLTQSGQMLEQWQKLDVLSGLRAMSMDAAWQLHEDQHKGSITVGKQADLVILDRNPVDMDPTALRDVRVMETIKAGKTVYQRKE